MSKAFQMKSQEQLLEQIVSDMLESRKSQVLIQAGHFPLMYTPNGATYNPKVWGDFSPYSLQLGTEIGSKLRNSGKEVKFVIVADDINYEETADNANFSYNQKRRMRRNFYKSLSGTHANLPGNYAQILADNGFSIADVIRQDQGSEGRRDSLVFSEKTLRMNAGPGNNMCAQAYQSLLRDPRYFDKERMYLISFVPDRCTGNVCSRVLDEQRDIYASHVFMQTDQYFLDRTDANAMWNQWGIYYRKDVPKEKNHKV